MLETVKSFISKDLPCISFDMYFVEYLISVQDSNIDAELKFLIRNNSLNVLSLGNAIDNIHRSIS